MKSYELTYLLSPGLSPEELEQTCQKVSGFIRQAAGTLEGSTAPKRTTLATPLKKQKQGEAFLATARFTTTPETLCNLEKDLTTEQSILRFTLMAVKKRREAPPRKASLSRGVTPSADTEMKREPIAEPPRSTEAAPKVELKEFDKKIEEILNE